MDEKNKSPIKNETDVHSLEDQKLTSRLQECPIAVIGIASVFANAKNLEQYWDNIFESVDAITDVPASRWNVDDYYSEDVKAADKTYCKRGGFLPEIDFDPMEFGLPPNILELTDIAQLLSLVVARDVLNDAGIGDGSGYDRDKVGITLGVGGGQKQITALTSRLQGPVLDQVLKASGIDEEDRGMIIDKFKKAYIGWEENSFPGMLGNVIAGRIANRFDFGGTNCVVDAACAGSLAAIKLAISDLLEYRSEVMISGGVCCDNSPFMYMSFSKTPAFTTNDDIRPFDNDSKGMMIGEGIGMMAFKRLEDAERDGDKIYAVLKGIGTSSDGRFKSIYAPRPEGQAKALKRAYEDAGFEPTTCGLIEAHGTGTKAGDAAEFSGLTQHFGHNNTQKQHIALGSVKSQIGHTKAAAGAAGMIKAILALHHKILPPTIHIDQPNISLDIENSPLYLNSQTRPWMPREDGIPRRAGVSSFGFGGTNYHMVLEEYQAEQSGTYRLNNVAQTLLITAEDEQGIKAALIEWQTKLSVDQDAQVYVFNDLVVSCALKTPEASQARCGFIAKNASEAISMIQNALKQFETKAGELNWSVPTGIYYRKSGLDVQGKVVALFSGQGSQYLNMGQDLTCNFPSMLKTTADMDAEFSAAGLESLSSKTFPIPVFTDEARKTQNETLRLTQYAQPAIGTFSVGLYKTFEQAGFKADFAAGHSFGELTALWASGVLSEQDYMMLARSRGQAMAAPEKNDSQEQFDAGTMIAVVGDPSSIAEDIKSIKDVSIANYNANNQVVVAGTTPQVAVAFKALSAKGYRVVQLPVSAAFHTPLVGHAQKPFAKAIDSAKFNTPDIPVFSNTTGKAHSNKAADIKNSLKEHILKSVQFNEEIDNIYADGGRVFIEFGPKNVLSKLVENILQDKTDVTAIAVNANPKKSGDLQMRQAALEMAVLGVSLESIDPYSAVKRPLEAPRMSPLAMKLSGASYVSEKTSKQFEDALNDGWQVKQASAVSVDVEKVVEKIVYVPVDASKTNTSDENDLVSTIEQSVSQFVDHQQQLLSVHEQYAQGPKDYAKTFQSVLDSQAGADELPESLDRTLNMYHEFQSETLRVHEQYLNDQSDNMSAMLNTLPDNLSDRKTHIDMAAPSPVPSVASTAPEPAIPSTIPSVIPPAIASMNTSSALALAPAEAPSAPQLDLKKIQTVMLDVVADKTGYPAEMLELSMDMEADLGIDSIKRVEILGAVQDTIPDLPELNPEDLAELRTLGEIVDYMQSKVPADVSVPTALHVVTSADSPVAATTSDLSAPVIDLAKIQKVMMDVVADKTGYPAEMLELSMDMEADLGIDSIKRVEILGAVQDTIPNLPELNPEDLAELRTLGEIVDYMQSKVSAASLPTLAVNAKPVLAIDLEKIQSVMMDVVADKTGYPAEMLELGMDMEADLGIDSIKRVEILGAVQDTLPDLPELNPEDLAELRTLGEIVEYMKSKISVESAPVPVPVPVVASAPTIDVKEIQQVMMSVVADKTGYPSEMLELAMDMEADLGIDSIKRVEILGAVQDTLPDLPELNPEDLAELRTLGEIVEYMQSKVQTQTDTSPKASIKTTINSDESLVLNPSVAFEPAPSATVAVQRLGVIKPIKQDATGANVLIVDDGTGATVKLAENLIKNGWKVSAIKPSWNSSKSKKSFPKAVSVKNLASLDEEQIKSITDKHALDAVIYMQSVNTIQNIEYPESAKQGLMLAFLLAKYCQVSNSSVTTKVRPSFIVVTRQGGGLGVDSVSDLSSEQSSDLVQSGLNGLVKTISHEWPEVFCRAVDVASTLDAENVAKAVGEELLDSNVDVKEVAYDQDGRITLTGEATDSYHLKAGTHIDDKSVFLVSGGAKGVTAHCVIHIAKAYQSRFILLGRSVYEEGEPTWAQGITNEADLKKSAMQVLIAKGEKPTPVTVSQFIKPVLANREISATLNAIRTAGGQVEYVASDVTNRESVQAAVKPVIEQFGEVSGIIHGAGVLADKFIEQKTLAEFDAVYRTKIDGLLSLLACVDQEKLKHLVLFSSAAGFYGNPGQSDYSIANEILNKTAYRFKALHPKAQVLSFNWGPWDGGMVTPELKRMFTERGVYIIPLEAGAELLLNELAAEDNRCPQILVGNDLSSDQTENSDFGFKTLDESNNHADKTGEPPVKKPLTVV